MHVQELAAEDARLLAEELDAARAQRGGNQRGGAMPAGAPLPVLRHRTLPARAAAAAVAAPPPGSSACAPAVSAVPAPAPAPAPPRPRWGETDTADQQRRRECCGPLRQQVEQPRPLGAVEQERRSMMEAARAGAEEVSNPNPSLEPRPKS